MKDKFQRFLVMVLSLMPSCVWAAGFEIEQKDLFEVGTSDASKQFLEMVFGTVGPVLHGTSGMFLGAVFKVFNLGIIVVAGLFLVWSTTKTILSTAEEGQFMGQQGKPTWLVIRTVMGFGLLTPSFTTGYSMIQVIVIWVVVQGVGFANTAWTEALTYIQNFGAVLAEPQPDIRIAMDLSGTILQMEVCMYYHEKVEQEKRERARDNNGVPVQDANYFPPFKVTDSVDSKSYFFPKSRGNEESDNGCGQLSYSFPDNSVKTDLARRGLAIVIDGLKPAARSIVELFDSHSPSRAAILNKRAQEMTTSAMLGAAADWINVTLPAGAAARLVDTNDKSPSDDIEGEAGSDAESYDMGSEAGVKLFFEDAKKLGWIYAGSYYYALGKLQGNRFEAADVKPTIVVGPLGYPVTGTIYIDFDTPLTIEAVFNGSATTPPLSSSDAIPAVLTRLYTNAVNYIRYAKYQALQIALENEGISVRFSSGVPSQLAPYLNPVKAQQNKSLENFSAPQNAAVDPIMKLKAMGDIMMIVAFVAMIVVSIAAFGVSGGLSSLSIVNMLPFALGHMFSFFIPIFFAMVVFIWTQGTMLAVYVPMIPFVIYSFAVIGWFAVVIEAMVAAPLVALGMTHPEGHDLLGAAQQGVMLLLSVFLKPILIVIGLIAGMVVSRVALKFLEMGFLNIAATTGSISFLAFIAMWCIYISLVIALVHTSYGLIHEVPDKVMVWVGVTGSTVGGHVQGALNAAESGAKESAAVAGELAGGVAHAARGLAPGHKEKGGGSAEEEGGGGDSPSLGSESSSSNDGTSGGGSPTEK